VHLSAVVLNFFLDPVLIFGLGPFPRMGVAGAAVATVFSQGVAAALSLAVLAKGKSGLRLSRRQMRPDARAWSLLLKIGLPSSIGQALSAFGFAVLQGLVNSFGAGAIAAFGVGSRIMGIFDIPTHGIALAVTSLAGKAMGAKDHAAVSRTVRASIILVVCLELPLLVLSVIFGGDLVRFFVNDPEAIRLGDIMFKMVSPSLLLFGLYMAISGAFQGAGDTKIIMILSIVRLWAIRVPFAYALALLTPIGPLSIWVAMFASNFLTACAGFVYFKKGKWKHALDPDSI
jgi:putative MATE family efflux protein